MAWKDQTGDSRPGGNNTFGKMKIFFGYGDGVGKTYAMAAAGQEARRSGTDVVCGYLTPGCGEEIKKLLEGMEMLKSKPDQEFNLDEALKRRPELILVDNLAHKNGEGCRHLKRYQDLKELLNAGINVYTTLNVCHIESLNDIVTAITGCQMAERVPDSVFDLADQVVLVDADPDELVKRLQKKEMGGSRKEEALSREKLTALRELALRRTADRLNHRVRGNDIREHILICLSSSPSNSRVIRAAARMAEAFHGSFTALFVETSSQPYTREADRKRFQSNVKLAEDLGAHVATVYGEDVPGQIAEYAKTSGVTKIVIGRSNNKKRFFLQGKNLIDKLTELSPNLDIYVIPDNQLPYAGEKNKRRWEIHFSLADFLKSICMVVLASAVGMFFYKLGFSVANIITVYILGVLFTSLITNGRVYGAFVSLVSVVVFNFLFTEPRFTLLAYDAGYPVTFLIMFIASFITSTLTMQVKKQARQAVLKAYRTEVLLGTNQKLQKAQSFDQILKETANQMIKLLNCTVLLYPAGEKGELEEPRIFVSDNHLNIDKYLTEPEREAAMWVYKNNRYAGATTGTLPGAECMYFAVRGQQAVFAVAGLAVKEAGNLDSFERDLLVAMLGECGLALEKITLDGARQQAELQAEQEQLRANLLRSISHDLRTPLTSISGNAGVLMANSGLLSEDKKMRLYTDIYDDSLWLINLVENLLSVTRIENGSMSIHMEPELVEEVFQEALRHLGRKAKEHRITIRLPEELLIARMDVRLILQVITNLVDNAIKYTPEESEIELSAWQHGDMIQMEIADNGPGVLDELKEKIFDMFYTAGNSHGDGRRGMGLGLALCKSIVAEHGGVIGVRDNDPTGSIFYFTLQATEVNTIEQTTDFSDRG